ncbi:MAG: hypothetical protein AAGU14_01390 [Eubacteriaceae bacterium]
MQDLIINITISLMTGVAASLIVSWQFKKYIDKKEHDKLFIHDKEEYRKHLEDIRILLNYCDIYENDIKIKILQAINAMPIRWSFYQAILSDESYKILEEINILLSSITNSVINGEMDENNIQNYCADLQRFQPLIIKMNEVKLRKNI